MSGNHEGDLPKGPALPPGPQLSGPQQGLHDALLRKSARCARMYLGALEVLEQGENPDRLALCGHGLRELIEKLHTIVDLPVDVARPTNLRNEVRRLEELWDGFTRKWDHSVPEVWDERFGTDLKALFGSLAGFFKTIAEIMPTRRDEMRKLLRGLDASGQHLAPAIEQDLVAQLEDFRGYFAGVAHHTLDTSDGTFRERLLGLETYLVERIVPRTYDEFREIDEILARDKSDAES